MRLFQVEAHLVIRFFDESIHYSITVRLGNVPHDISDPGGSILKVFYKLSFVIVTNFFLEILNNRLIYMPLGLP
jgi:hypothetical protein